MDSLSATKIGVLILLGSLEKYTRELAAEILLPSSCVLGRNQVDLVEHQEHLLTSLTGLRFNLGGPATKWISGIKNLDNDIGGLNKLVDLFVFG